MQAPATTRTEIHPRLRHWEECKNALREKIPSPFFHTFIQPIQAMAPENQSGREHDEGPLLLSIPGEKLLKHIEARYYPIILGTLRDVRFQGQVSLISRSGDTQAFPVSNPAPTSAAHPENDETIAAANAPGANLPGESARAFIAHPENRPATHQLRSLAFPGSLALLTGPSGSGKTMLAREIVQSLNTSPGATADKPLARYLSLETFLTEFSLACRDKDTIQWRKKLREHSLLIIDDFQFIKGTAKKSMEEIRNLLDDFESRDFKLILCSDTDFNRLPLQADLKSRMYPGYRVELRWPDAHGRARILEGELNRLGLNTSVPLEYLAGRITGDIRKITSAAIRLKHRSSPGAKQGDDSTESLTTEILDGLLEDLYESPREIDPNMVLEKVAKFFKLNPAAVTGPAREKKFVLARHLTAYLCTEHLKMKLTDTAALLGRKDHGSIIHARKKILELMEKDLFLKKQIHEIMTSLRIGQAD